MRAEKWTVDNLVHLVRRGSRGLPILKNESDAWRHLKVMYYMNDSVAGQNSIREIENLNLHNKAPIFSWPRSWPKREPLFELAGFTLLQNHLHMIGFETIDNGISKYMHKSGISMAKYFNLKYKEHGSLFQSPYKAKVVDSDDYLLWVVPYIMVKNTFEMHPKGLNWATANFEEAWGWGVNYPFSSLGDYAGVKRSPVVDTTKLKKLLGSGKQFKETCRDMIEGRRVPLHDDWNEY